MRLRALEIGATLWAAGHPDDAIPELRRALTLFGRSARPRRPRARARLMLGRVLSASGRHEEAVRHLLDARDELDRAVDPVYVADAETELGVSATAMGATGHAREHLAAAADLYASTGLRTRRDHVRQLLADLPSPAVPRQAPDQWLNWTTA